jgi:hypothetical protein
LYVAGTTNLVGDVSMNSKLIIGNDVSFNSKLFVVGTSNFVGDVSMNSKLIVGNDVSFNSKLFIAGDVSMNSILTVNGNVNFNGSSTFTVYKNSVFYNSTDFNSELNMNGPNGANILNDFTVTNGNVYFTGTSSKNFNVTPNVIFDNKLRVDGDVSLNSTVFANRLTNSFTVSSGNITISNANLMSRYYIYTGTAHSTLAISLPNIPQRAEAFTVTIRRQNVDVTHNPGATTGNTTVTTAGGTQIIYPSNKSTYILNGGTNSALAPVAGTSVNYSATNGGFNCSEFTFMGVNNNGTTGWYEI